ncbi:hypothetical protein [Ruminococcus albus]|nr:hypothetical protein [Ruminococcus albus]
MRRIGKMYRNISSVENGKKKLIKLNVCLLLWIAVLHIPGMVLFYFNDTKSMYNIKKADYVYGVQGINEKNKKITKKLLPEKLPEKCENYSYMTEGVLTPYHATSCLVFRTDDETIEDYAEHYGVLCDEVRVKNEDNGEKKTVFDEFLHKAEIMSDLDESRLAEFDNAEFYRIDGHFPIGVLIDRDSGYVVILT